MLVGSYETSDAVEIAKWLRRNKSEFINTFRVRISVIIHCPRKYRIFKTRKKTFWAPVCKNFLAKGENLHVEILSPYPLMGSMYNDCTAREKASTYKQGDSRN